MEETRTGVVQDVNLPIWSNGDFNCDGKINILDYADVIDSNIANQGVPFFTAGGAGGSVEAVPEPGSHCRFPPCLRSLSLRAAGGIAWACCEHHTSCLQ
jgi:hypothetical protein